MTDINWYTTVFKAWQAKVAGSKPTAEMLATIHGLGCRPGKQAMANAMCLRPEGATNSQIVFVCGAAQNNKRGDLIKAHLVKRVAISPGANNHTVYKIELTAKGTQKVESVAKREAEAEANGMVETKRAVKRPSKAKGAVKAPKARVAKGKASKRASGAASPAEAALITNPEQAADFAAGNGIELIPDSNGIEYDNPHDE